ncbi:unnamed protein product, partial [Prorocentrum cordatum]
VGVHTGPLGSIVLPSGREGYFGDALSTARYLAESAPRDAVVHLSKATKEQLCVLERPVVWVRPRRWAPPPPPPEVAVANDMKRGGWRGGQARCSRATSDNPPLQPIPSHCLHLSAGRVGCRIGPASLDGTCRDQHLVV